MPAPKPTRRTQPSKPVATRRPAGVADGTVPARHRRDQRPAASRSQGFNPGFKRR